MKKKRCRRIGKADRFYAVFHRAWDGDRIIDRRECDSGSFSRNFPAAGISSFLPLKIIYKRKRDYRISHDFYKIL
jgi:hypothetical protein